MLFWVLFLINIGFIVFKLTVKYSSAYADRVQAKQEAVFEAEQQKQYENIWADINASRADRAARYQDDYMMLGLDHFPVDLAELNKARKQSLFHSHPDRVAYTKMTSAQAQARTNSIETSYERLAKLL